VDGELIKACEPLGRNLPFARVRALHLSVACTVLDAFKNAMLVVSTAIRAADRDVIEERAFRVEAPVLWVRSDHDVNDVVTSIHSWATAPRT